MGSNVSHEPWEAFRLRAIVTTATGMTVYLDFDCRHILGHNIIRAGLELTTTEEPSAE
jgi:hypothetical protein